MYETSFARETMRIIILSVCLVFFFTSCKQELKITTSSAEARRAYKEGVSLLDQFYFSEAKEAFDHALQLDSNFAVASARLALVHERTGNERDARIEISRAIAKSSHASLSEQLFIRLINHMLYFRNTDAARVADSLIALYPLYAEPYVFRGDLYELNKAFDVALQMYEEAVQADTGYAPAAMALGYAYSTRGDVDKAILAMERYIMLEPGAADPRASFGDILLRAGRYEEALHQYRKSLELKPDYWYAINKIGDVYAVLGRLSEAERQYALGLTKMLVNDQVKANYWAREASLETKRGRYDEALRLYKESLALDSLGGRAAFGIAGTLIELKRFDDAKNVITAIREEIERRNLSGSGAMLEFHLLRAKLLEKEGSLDHALAECDSALGYGSALNRTFVNLEIASIQLRQGEFDGAISALEEALHYNPNAPVALLLLTKIYHANGEKDLMNEIGGRVLDLWRNADKDFQDLIELKKLLSKSSAPVSPSA